MSSRKARRDRKKELKAIEDQGKLSFSFLSKTSPPGTGPKKRRRGRRR